MRKELQARLEQEFPFMRRGKTARLENIYSQWGCECMDGWYPLLRGLCLAITARYRADGLAVDLTVLQIKEKFAALRFCCAPGAGGSPDEAAKKRWADVARIIARFEDKSREVCEFCGRPGAVRTGLGRRRALCPACHEGCLQKMKERRAAHDPLREKARREEAPEWK